MGLIENDQGGRLRAEGVQPGAPKEERCLIDHFTWGDSFSDTGGRTRTDTMSPLQDFESSASTNFATPAFSELKGGFIKREVLLLQHFCQEQIVLFDEAIWLEPLFSEWPSGASQCNPDQIEKACPTQARKACCLPAIESCLL